MTMLRRNYLAIPILVFLVLSLMVTGTLADNSQDYGAMRYRPQELQQLSQLYSQASPYSVSSKSPLRSLGVNLLYNIKYDPILWNQNPAVNCWVFAGTAALENELFVKNGTSDTLSVEYFDASFSKPTTGEWAGVGGSLKEFAEFYKTHPAIPWNNINAYYADGATTGNSESAKQGKPWYNADRTDGLDPLGGRVSANPNYPVDKVDWNFIKTSQNPAGQSGAISSIESVLDNGHIVVLTFSVPDDPLPGEKYGRQWNKFRDFWSKGQETDQFDLSQFNQQTFTNAASHVVIIYGYYDPGSRASGYWLCLNSWGVTNNRPSGTFRLPMNMDYNSTIIPNPQSGQLLFPSPIMYFAYINATFGTPVSSSPRSSSKISVKAYPSTVHLGEETMFKAQVTEVKGDAKYPPTGQVQFIDANQFVGMGQLDNRDGEGTTTFSRYLDLGSHSINAYYWGDGSYAPSSYLGIPVQVQKAISTINLKTSKTPTVFGEPFTICATVINPSTLVASPTGIVSFVADDSISLGSTKLRSIADQGSDGTAQITISSLASGPHSIKASYSGDSNYQANSTIITQTVKKADTSTTIEASKIKDLKKLTSIRLIARVSVLPPGLMRNKMREGWGNVNFTYKNTIIGSAPVIDGVATYTYTTTSLIEARPAIKAVYLGSANLNPSTSDILVINAP